MDIVTTTARLTELEAVIERGRAVFVEVGEALLEIRDHRLYRPDYPTFDAYCRERWGWSRVHAYRQIAAARVAAMLPMGNSPATERQARELVPLMEQGPEVVQHTWAEATADGPATAAMVRAAAQRHLASDDALAWAAGDEGVVTAACDTALVPSEGRWRIGRDRTGLVLVIIQPSVPAGFYHVASWEWPPRADGTPDRAAGVIAEGTRRPVSPEGVALTVRELRVAYEIVTWEDFPGAASAREHLDGRMP